MTLGKRKDTGILKKKQGIALSGKLALEGSRDLWSHKLRNELVSIHMVSSTIARQFKPFI
jgi:hypothetical protein